LPEKTHLENTIQLSIVIPTYNKADFLALLLESLLQQDYPQHLMDIIVVDDGSTDHTAQVIDQFYHQFKFFTCIRQPNKGIGAARNAGVKAASAEFIAFLADDYILSPFYCSALIPVFNDSTVTAVRSYPGSVGNTSLELLELYQIRLSIWRCLYGTHKIPNFRFGDLPLPPHIEPLTEIISWGGAAMMRRSIFEKFGYFDEALVTGEDTEYAYRLAVKANIRMHFCPAVLFNIQFRTGFSAYMKRCYEYAFNGEQIAREYHPYTAHPPRTNKLYRKLSNMLLILCQNGNPARAAMMAPYLLSSRIAAAIGKSRG